MAVAHIGPNTILAKTFTAGAAIAINTIVKFTTDDKVINSTAVADLSIGVALEAAAADGDRIDVAVMGIANVKAAGVIAAGESVVPTTAGEGIILTPAATVGTPIGRAMGTVADNDIFPMLITPYEAVTA